MRPKGSSRSSSGTSPGPTPGSPGDLVDASEPSSGVLRFTRRSGATFDIILDQASHPSIANFRIDGQDLVVTPGTVISGSKTFSYTVHGPNLVSGDLTLAQDGNNLLTNISSASSSTTTAVTSTTLTNAGDSTEFTLSGVDTDTNAFSAQTTIRAVASSGFAYWLVTSAASITAAEVVDGSGHPQSGVTRSEASTGGFFDIRATVTAGQYLHVLVPDDHTSGLVISDTTIPGTPADITSVFDVTADAITLNSVDLDDYANGPLNPGEINMRVTLGGA